MSSDVKAMTTAALEKGDPSQLCTKNIDGHMFLVLASELESTSLDDGDSSSTESGSSSFNSDGESSDFETDSFYSDNDADSPDSSEEITISLLDENGKEFEEISFKDSLYRPSPKSIPDILKNLPATPELISEQLGHLSSQVLPNTSTKETHFKILPPVSSNSGAHPSTYNTYIIKTTLPLSALELKSLICSSGSHNTLAGSTLSKRIPITSSNTSTKPNILVKSQVSSHQNNQSISSSVSNGSLLSKKPVTTTTNIITNPISSVNKISFLDKSLIPVSSSSSSFNTKCLVTIPTCTSGQLPKTLSVPICTTTNNQLSQSIPIAPANVIKPVNPVIDTGQLVPKVQIINKDFSGSLITSQSLASNVQSKSSPTCQINQLVNVSNSNSQNCLQMTPCLIISDSASLTSSTHSLIKKPIVHTGFVPQNLLANAKSNLNQTAVMSGIIPQSISLASSTSHISPTSHAITTMVQNSLQPTTTVTSSVSKPLVSFESSDSVLNPSTTKVPTITSTLGPSSSAAAVASASTSAAAAEITTKTSSTPHAILPAPKSNTSFGPYFLKLLPKSTTSNECVLSLQPIDSSSAMPQNKNYLTCLTKSSSDSPNPVQVSNANDKPSEVQGLSINSSSLATTAENSLQTSDESKASKNNVKTISLLTPIHAKSIFYPKDSLLRNNYSSEGVVENLLTNLESKTATSLNDSAITNNDFSSATKGDLLPPITTNSITSVSAANASKLCQEGDKPQDPVIVLTKPLIPDPSSVTPAKVSSPSTSVTSNSSHSELGITIKTEPEDVYELKKDESVQFLKLGSFLINEANIKKELDDDSSETANSNTEQKPDDSVKLDSKSFQKLTENPLNDEANLKTIKIKPISDSSNNSKTPDTSSNKNEPNIVRLNQTAPVLNLNTTGNNSSLMTVPTSLVSGRQISIPAQSLLSSSNQFVNLSDLASTSGTKFVTLASKPIASSQILTLKSPSSQIATLPNQGQTGAPLLKLQNQISTSAQVVTLTNTHPKTTALVSLTTNAPTSTSVTTPAVPKAKLVPLASKLPNNAQIVSLTSQTTSGTQYFKITSKSPNCTQYLPVASALPTGTQLLPLTNKPSSAAHFIPLATNTPTGTQLLSSPSQTPSISQLVTLPSKTPTGIQLLSLTSQAPTVSQLVSLQSQTPRVTQLVSLTNQTPTCTQSVSLPTQTATGTQLLPISNQNLTGSHLIKITPKTPSSAQFIQLANQVPTCTQLSTLTNPPPTHIKICPSTTPAQTGTQLVALTTKPSSETQFLKFTNPVSTSEPQLVKLANLNSSAAPHYLKLYSKSSTGQLIPLTNSTSLNSSVVPLTTQASTTEPQFVTMSSQASPVVTFNPVKTGAQIVTLNSQKSTDSGIVPLINQETANRQFVALTNQNLSSGSQLVKLPNATVSGTQLVRIPAPLTPKVKLIPQNISGTQFIKLSPTTNASPSVKIVPINNSPVLQLSNPTKPMPEGDALSKSGGNKEPILNIEGTSSSSGNLLSNVAVSNIFSKLQNNESSAVVVSRKTASDISATSTSASSINKAVSMQSLLPPKIILQSSSPKILQKPSTSPPKSSPLKTDTKTNTAPTEDSPMTLKIGSIFSLQGLNKGLDYWKTSSLQPPMNSPKKPVNIPAEIKPAPNPDQASSKLTEAEMPETAVEQQKKIILKNSTTSENVLVSLPSPKPIVYARLNKPKPIAKPIPITPKPHPLVSKRKEELSLLTKERLLSLSRFNKPMKMISIIRKAYKPRMYPIHGRIHVDRIKKKKYQFLQPRVLLSQLFLPSRMKYVNMSKLPLETKKSLKCNSDCVHKLRVPYLSTSLVNGKSSPPQHLMVMRVDGKSVVKPCSPDIGTKPYFVLKDNSNVPISLSAKDSSALVLKQGEQPISANIFTVPSTSVSKVPLSLSSLKNISPLKVGKGDKVQSQNSSGLPSNKDDALNCLQLACGIIQDNTLKRKSSVAEEFGWKEDHEDSDWSLDLEMPYRLKKRRISETDASSSDLV